MKKVLPLLVGILVFCGFIYLDYLLVDFIVSQFPPSVKEWLGIIKIVVWLVVLSFTFSISLAVSLIVGIMLGAVLKYEERKKNIKETEKLLESSPSKWQKRLEELQKQAKEQQEK